MLMRVPRDLLRYKKLIGLARDLANIDHDMAGKLLCKHEPEIVIHLLRDRARNILSDEPPPKWHAEVPAATDERTMRLT